MEPEPEPEPAPAPEPAPLEAAGASWRPFDCVDEEVLLKIFARLAPKSLVRAGLVCREWHAQSCDDELWAALHNTVLVDRSKMHRLRKDTLFARAHYSPDVCATLGVRELKAIIAQRRLQARAAPLREKAELAALVAQSSYPPLSARHYVLPTKWKASFAHAWADTRRVLMSVDDLVEIDWTFEFHEHRQWQGDAEIHSRFYADNTYWSDFRPNPQEQGHLTWRFVAGGRLQVHHFPPFDTMRTKTGGWRLNNHIGVFTCHDRIEGCKHGPKDTAVGS